MTTVYPASIDTPFFEHARSRMGVQPRPVAPVYDPRVVARAIAAAAERPLRDVHAGGAGRLLSFAMMVAPGLVDRYMSAGRRMERAQQTERPDDRVDNLDGPAGGPGRSRGQFGAEALPTSSFTDLVEVHPVRRRLAPVAALAAAGLTFAALRSLAGRIRR
jgi:hypothetical protein